jgi:hypothetical protein
MDKRLFLESIGIGAAFALTATCLQSCKHESLVSPPITTGNTGTTSTTGGTTGGGTNTPTSFIIDLESASYTDLKNNGKAMVRATLKVAPTYMFDSKAFVEATFTVALY